MSIDDEYTWTSTTCKKCGKEFVACKEYKQNIYNMRVPYISDYCYFCCADTNETHKFPIFNGMMPHNECEWIECEKCHVLHNVRQWNKNYITIPVVCHTKEGGCGRTDETTRYTIYVNLE